jgi:glycerol-3-phosphate acyltransferase PlsY
MRGVVVPALTVVVAYLIGTFPSAQVVGRRLGVDPTRAGSGNPGATNMYRTAGRRAGAAVLAGDLVKGAAAAGVGLLLGDRTLAVAAAGAAVLGHVLPVTRRFHGGKGAATYAGGLLVTFPLLGLAGAAGWALLAATTRRASIASIVLAVAMPVAAGVTGANAREVAVVAVAGALVVLRHRENIARLAHGAEHPIEAGRR